MCHLLLSHVFHRDKDVLYSNMTRYHNEVKLSELLQFLNSKRSVFEKKSFKSYKLKVSLRSREVSLMKCFCIYFF